MMSAQQADRRGSDGLAGQPQGFLLLRRDGVLQARRVLMHFMAQFKQVIT